MKTLFRSIFFLIFYMQPIFSAEKVTSIMIPKCGTHLLLKCLHLLDSVRMPEKHNQQFPFEKWYKANKYINRFPPPHHYKGLRHPINSGKLPASFVRDMKRSKATYFDTHFHFTPEFNRFLDTQKSKKILMIRDPRAFLISFALLYLALNLLLLFLLLIWLKRALSLANI